MPMPPILETIDWRAVFEAGIEWPQWIHDAAEHANCERMEIDRREFDLDPHCRAALAALPRPVYVVAIAEPWCGDVVRHAPVLAKMNDMAENLLVSFITRQQFPRVFERFLTNGGEAIPKFIFLNDRFVECGNWGPMPAACRELIARGKALGDGALARERVTALYQADPLRRETARELMALIDIASTTQL